MIKRILSLVLVLCLLVCSLPAVSSYAASSSGGAFWGAFDFSDGFSYSSSFYADCSGYLYDNGEKYSFDCIELTVSGTPTLWFGYNWDFFVELDGNSNFSGIVYIYYTEQLSGAAFSFLEDIPTISYSLTFNLNGGSWPDSSFGGSYSGTFNDSLFGINTPIKPGFTFVGWTVEGPGVYDGSHNEFIFGDGSAVLSARWSSAVEDDSFLSVFWIDGKTYSFTAETGAPTVYMTVNLSEIILYEPSHGEAYISVPEGFIGLSLSDGGDIVYSPGSTYTFDGGFGVDRYFILYFVLSGYDPPDQSDEFIIPAGQYEAKKLVMTGEYNALPSWPDDLDVVPFSFVSSGVSYQSMSTGLYLPTGQLQLQYGQDAAYRYAASNIDPGFTQDAYALIYLTEAQAVSPEFYSWFLSAFKLVSSDPIDPKYSIVLNIWDNSGSVLHRSITYSDSICPIASIQVVANGCLVSCPDQLTYSWVSSDEFYGFALSAYSFGAYFTPGNTYDLPGGGLSSVVMDLYVVSSLPDEQQYKSGILGLLERIADKLSEWVDSNISFPELGSALSVIDFTSIKEFFVEMYDNVRTVFGLSTLLTDPSGPFAWLLES